jgi:hypothetical protein
MEFLNRIYSNSGQVVLAIGTIKANGDGIIITDYLADNLLKNYKEKEILTYEDIISHDNYLYKTFICSLGVLICMVKHKLFGMGKVINKEVVGDYTYITARFDTGKELRFVIPTSFETGAVEAIGTLKDEVEQAIADREARRAVTTTPVAVATPTVPATRTRTKPKTTATGPMADAFEKYLINKGYKIETDKGKRSTVYFYLDAV